MPWVSSCCIHTLGVTSHTASSGLGASIFSQNDTSRFYRRPRSILVLWYGIWRAGLFRPVSCSARILGVYWVEVGEGIGLPRGRVSGN